MIRQAFLAIGVALFIALLGKPSSMEARLGAFHTGWQTLAAVTLVGLIPAFLFIAMPSKLSEASDIV